MKIELTWILVVILRMAIPLRVAEPERVHYEPTGEPRAGCCGTATSNREPNRCA